MSKRSDLSTPVDLPPVTTTREGEPRHVGIELEMAGIGIEAATRVVADYIGGSIHKDSYYENSVKGDNAGDWKVVLDADLLKHFKRDEGQESETLRQLGEATENVVRAGAEIIVPVEVSSPPLPMERLGDMRELVAKLHDAGAKGTGDSALYAFGMHFNPEAPNLDATTITNYLKAFLCLYEWLAAEAEVDLTRRLTPYIDPFPRRYARLVVDPHYQPDMPTLIDDYLHHNPTRNRPLDMLPLFAHVDEARIRDAISDERIKARPAFHYRLPNCDIDQPDWNIDHSWHGWLEVEYLAMDEDRLAALCQRYHALLGNPIRRRLTNWEKETRQWLTRNSGR